jgi:hypothetical protein
LCECLGYKSAELEECVLILHDLYLSRRAASFKAVRDKYKQKKVIVLTFNLYFVTVNSCYCKLFDLKLLSGTVQICGKLAFPSRDTS